MYDQGTQGYEPTGWRRWLRRPQTAVLVIATSSVLVALITFLVSDNLWFSRIPVKPPEEGVLVMPSELQTKVGEEFYFSIIVEPRNMWKQGGGGGQPHKTLVADSAVIYANAVESDSLDVTLLTPAKQPVSRGDGRAEWNVRIKSKQAGVHKILVDYEIVLENGFVWDLEAGRHITVRSGSTVDSVFQAASTNLAAIAAVIGSITVIVGAITAINNKRVQHWFKSLCARVMHKPAPAPIVKPKRRKTSKKG